MNLLYGFMGPGYLSHYILVCPVLLQSKRRLKCSTQKQCKNWWWNHANLLNLESHPLRIAILWHELQLLILPPALRHYVVTGIWCRPEAVKAPETIGQDMPKSNQEQALQVPLRSRTKTMLALCHHLITWSFRKSTQPNNFHLKSHLIFI